MGTLGQWPGVTYSFSSAYIPGWQQTQVIPKLAQAAFIAITEIYSKLVLHGTEQGFIDDSEFLLVTIRVLLLLVPLPSDELLACCSPHYSTCLQLQMGQSWLVASESLSGRQINGRSLVLGLETKFP